jgi:hypothetical protein
MENTPQLGRTAIGSAGGPTTASGQGLVLARASLLLAAVAVSVGAGPVDASLQRTRATERLIVPKSNGASFPLNVAIKDWNCPPGACLLPISPHGPTIVYVRNGRITVEVGGRLAAYGAGSFFAVPAGATIEVTLTPRLEGSDIETITAEPAP